MGIWSVTKTVFLRFFKERFYDQSAQTAYYFLLSLFPFLIFAISILRFFPFQIDEVLKIVEPFAPKGSYGLINQTLNSVLYDRQTPLASFSLLAAFWLASMAVQSLGRSLNDAYQYVREGSFLSRMVRDLFLTASLMIILSLSLFIPIAEEFARLFMITNVEVPRSFNQLWLIIKWGMGSLFLFVFFLYFYKIVPSKKVPLLSVLPGALFTTIGWQGVSVGFSYYVSFGTYTKIYGQLGSIIVLMFWFYLTAAVILIGGLINASIERG